MAKWVYTFGGGAAEGGIALVESLGAKGAGLAEMSALGLPVPPGFTITTEICQHYLANGHAFPEELTRQVAAALDGIGHVAERRFGDCDNPLLVSVRSGAAVSMPGMMDTVLNLGLNDQTVEGLARVSGDRRFAFDSYRRFIQMYGDVVLGLDHSAFEERLEDYKLANGLAFDSDLSADDWRAVCDIFKGLVVEELDEAFPQAPEAQLWGAIRAVIGSWNNPRAVVYRRINGISGEAGTAVTIQAMVFGNLGESSATGVAFTRHPSTGEKVLWGEFLPNAQGEDVVAGTRTPQDLTERARAETGSELPSLESSMPEVFATFSAVCAQLERHHRDVLDLEFTVERGRLWMLQARPAKRTIRAALKTAVDMAHEGLITKSEAVARIEPRTLDQLLHPTIDPDASSDIFARGLPASPGAASGTVVFSSEEAETARTQGRKVILVRVETSPEDVHGMHAARGILTTRGGMTSHAAVVARGMGKPCVSGAGQIRVDFHAGTMTAGGRTIRRGDTITIDGGTGQVLVGAVPLREPELSGAFAELMGWADEIRTLKIRTNVDTPADARAARGFGAEGIGLCRTEHMFFDARRITVVREMILAETEAARADALDKLLPMQRSDFAALFEIMSGLPVTIRLLDPPLHEFLPKGEPEIAELAAAMGVAPARIRARTQALAEANPMLGHRGVRLAISFPEIVEMQVRAILEAALAVGDETGVPVELEIMVPLIAAKAELDLVGARIRQAEEIVRKLHGRAPAFQFGTMIELPRAALAAGELAKSASFFSFGTNDLTQTTFGISRDDAAPYLNSYLALGLLPHDPFASLDEEGVGELIRIACERGRATRPDIKIGVCGEHGGDPASIHFFAGINLDYVSCSPFRVPIARLAAAQAALSTKA
ncbi:pyruvate, phosphate dikinase [Kaistia dalseonensis]|uniref:Pyruvate, phosphate dikinase n=1 Tax=Kaistia dalseonensis TaxID=410840 RepID=A0ABU0HCZ0_9HYPH|nr:pyruvate, phosphate dikinase [Kaistia dalseonensis]MCX5497506.1 pyruvate, phosphate dikinase [Kaistia dalseonensis]MDQ0440145.1 pyruvate,orthophosphate dikinase [Kaistia dalseonensis]